ncbi:MAG: multidrug effflux MFS transporter, partial [Chromatiales bacterium]|nr:multidrug effflux MFS transporter [Chromatiales bacterium]
MHPEVNSYRGLLPLSLVVGVLSMLAPFSIDTYLPSFPDIAAEFVASPLQMQQTMSLYLLAFALSTLFYGPLSDSFGRRPVAVAALLFYTFSSLGCMAAENINQLIVFRIGQGLSASAGLVIGRAMIRDCVAGLLARRVMARVMLIFALAPAVAPVMGGLLHDLFGWRSVFAFLSILVVVMMAMLLLGSRETLPREGRHSIHPVMVGRAYGRALRHGRFMGLITSFALMFSAMFIYLAASPDIIYQHLGLGVNDFWIFFVPVVGGVVVGSQLAGWLASRLTSEQTIRMGFVLMLAAACLNVMQGAWLPAAILNVIAPPTIYVIGMSMAMPNITLAALDCFPHNRGMASALQSFS